MRYITLIDTRDEMGLLDTIFGKVSNIDNHISIYKHGKRYPIVDGPYRYIDGSPVMETLLPMDIVDNDMNLLVSKEEIESGTIHTAPYMSIYSAKVITEILYAIIYFSLSNEDRALIYNDPLNITSISLIPYHIVGNNIVESIEHILSRLYYYDEDKIESFIRFYLKRDDDGKYNILKRGIIFDVDSSYILFRLINRGTPKEFRYQLGLDYHKIKV